MGDSSKQKKMQLIFIHGFSSNSLTWGELDSRFQECFDCHFIDLIGFGSEKPNTSFDFQLDSWSNQIADYITKNITDGAIGIIAHSMGAGVALNGLVLGILNPKFIVLINPLIYPQKIPLPIRILSNTFIDKMVSSFVPPKIQIQQGFKFVHHCPDRISKSMASDYLNLLEISHFRETMHQTIKNLSEADHGETTSQFSSIQTPVYLVRGMIDRVISEDSFNKMLMDFDFEKVFKLENCGHVPQEECPETVNKHLGEILKGEDTCGGKEHEH